MQPARLLREKLNSGVLVTGALATNLQWPELVEICRLAGLDYLILDMEHGSASEDVIADICAVGRLADFPVLLRPYDNDYRSIGKAMDLGPCGFLLARVEQAADLDVVRDGVYLPPRGLRRPGGRGNRWLSSVHYADWKAGVEDHFIVLPQIESRTGMANARAIAAHELTTALAIGPYDLSADLGVCWQPEHASFREAVDALRQTAADVGKPFWMIGDGPALAQQGHRFVCLAEPTMLLQAALREKVQLSQKACEG